MIGMGEMWHPGKKVYMPADKVLEEFNVKPLDLAEKEGMV